MAGQVVRKSSSPRRGRIEDERGRRVTQLDPVALHLLRQHDVIDAEALRAIVVESGVRITVQERASLVIGIVALLAVTSLFTAELLTGGLTDAPYAKFSSLMLFAILLLVNWFRVKHARFAHVAKAMLEHARCPHCGYHLAHLPVDPEDGATVCSECGCAWKLDRLQEGDDG